MVLYPYFSSFFSAEVYPTNNISFVFERVIPGKSEAIEYKKYLTFIRESLGRSKGFPLHGIM